MKATTIAILGIIAISFLIGIYLYPQMPERMASHWGAQGEVNGYASRFVGLFLMPLISVFIFLLLMAVPKIDPFKKNIEKFKNYYEGFILFIILFLFYIYALSLAWNLDYRFNMTTMMTPALGLLFYYTGALTENAKRNWFIGIKTPWTLSSDIVWAKTHKLGGKMFKASGIIALSGIFFPKYAIWFILVPALFTAVYTFVYSYVEYKKLKKK